MVSNIINSYKKWIPACGLLFVVSACGNLDIEGTDSIITEETDGAFTGVENPSKSVDDLYGSIYGQMGNQENFFALSEVTTDELLVPTRGTDWGDNGIWRTLHAHTWTPSHQYILNVWNEQNQNVYRATEVIDERSGASAEEAAHARFIRAFSMFIIMDAFGQAPFRNPDEGADVNPNVMTRKEAYDFVLNDINEALKGLPAKSPGGGLNRASKAAAHFLKAKLLLNAHIYRGEAAASSADMQGVIDAVDAIEDAGFALQEGYFEIFEETADDETIWYLETSVGNRIWNGLHYNQISPDNTGGGWNGFTTLAEFYDIFEGDPDTNVQGSDQEERRGWVPDESNADETNLGIGYGFVFGQQYDAKGKPLKDRAGSPLYFDKELTGIIGNNERQGIRVIKYHPVNGAFTGHELIFRFADAYLMRAEAKMRMGTDVTDEVNVLRELRDAKPIDSITEDDLLEERGRELYIEFWRRNDLIRFGKFTSDWPYKEPSAVGDENRNLFPIPSNALLSNPNLKQNPGY